MLIAHRVSAAHPDPTFGTNGKVTTDVSGRLDEVRAVIVATGSAGSFPAARFAVVQYNVDGSLDEAFGVSGAATIGFDKDARAHALATLQDGKLLICGIMNNGSSADGVVARLTSVGTLDASFGVNGRIQTDVGTSLRTTTSPLLSTDPTVGLTPSSIRMEPC